VSVKSTTQSITIDLPYPPSTNRYWRRVGNKTVLSRDARLYIKQVREIWFMQRLDGARGLGESPLSVEIRVHPPDRRRRDLDNVLKAALDSLQHAGVFCDDSQIVRLVVEKADCVPEGALHVEIIRHE